MQTQVGAERLAKHIEFLRGVPDHGFEMQYWYSKKTVVGNCVLPRSKPPQKQDASCDTAACVAGWFVVAEPDYWENDKGYPRLIVSENDSVYDSVSIFLEITWNEARRICDPAEYEHRPSKEVVLQRMIGVGKENSWDVSSYPAKRLELANE